MYIKISMKEHTEYCKKSERAYDTDFMTLIQRPKQPGTWQTHFIFMAYQSAEHKKWAGLSKAHAHSCKHVEVAGISWIAFSLATGSQVIETSSVWLAIVWFSNPRPLC